MTTRKISAKLAQNLVLQPMYKYFNKIANSYHISAWKSNGLFDESIKPLAASNNSFAPMLNPISIRLQIKLNVSCLKQDKITFTHNQVVNIYIMYKINL